MNTKTLLSLLAAVVLITLVGILGLNYFGSKEAPATAPEPETVAPAPEPEHPPEMVTVAKNEDGEVPVDAASDAIEMAEANQSDSEDSEFYWDDKLTNILDNDQLSDRDLGKQLLVLSTDPKAPIEIREDAFRNALVFTDDENFDSDILPLAIRTDLPETLNDEVLEDLYNRDPEVILPAVRKIAAIPGHPLSGALDEYAKEIAEEYGI